MQNIMLFYAKNSAVLHSSEEKAFFNKGESINKRSRNRKFSFSSTIIFKNAAKGRAAAFPLASRIFFETSYDPTNWCNTVCLKLTLFPFESG